MIKGEPADQQWHHGGEALNLNSYGNFSAGDDQQSNHSTLFLNGTPRGFIDAWSNGASDDQSATSRNTGSGVSSNGKLSQSSLSLSMGGFNSMDDEMGQIEMGLGLIESDQNRECSTKSLGLAPASWTGATPGGPLAEVIQLSSANTGSQSSPAAENGESGSPPATAVSSPSGVLQKTLASFSDSSSNSSPVMASSQKAKSEIGLLWLNR